MDVKTPVFGFNLIAGYQALNDNLNNTGSILNNIILGPFAGRYAYNLSNSIIIGNNSGTRISGQSDHVYIGNSAGNSLTGGLKNVIIGSGAASGLNTIGGYVNTILGSEAGYNLDNGNNNFIGGYRAGYNLRNLNNSVLIGLNAGFNTGSGNNNVSIGIHAGHDSLYSNNSVAIGSFAGINVQNSTSNIFIGENTGANNTNSTLSGCIAIGREAKVDSNYQLSIGSSTYPLTGTYYGDLLITGNLSAIGNVTRLDTFVEVTSAVSIINRGTGPALSVEQFGSQPIAHFVDQNGDDIIFADNGNLGLGIYNPQYKLDARVTASNSLQWVASFINPYNAATTLQGAGIKLQIDNPNDLNWFCDKKWVGLAAVAEKQFSDELGFAIYTQGNIGNNPGNSPTEKFRITGTGNVGIGTITPTEKLTVSGNISANGTFVLDTSTNNTAFRITQRGTGDIIRVEDSDNPDTTPFIIDNEGRTITGYISAVPLIHRFQTTEIARITPSIQNHGTGASSSNALYKVTENETPSILFLAKGRNTSMGNVTAVRLNDNLGKISFVGYEGQNFTEGATIEGVVSSNISLSSVPTDIRFNTSNTGVSNISERMRITSLGRVGIGTATPNERLTVFGNISASQIITAPTISASQIVTAPAISASQTVTASTVDTINLNTNRINGKLLFDPFNFNYVSLREDFGTGGTANGTIGQLGWHVTGSGATFENSFRPMWPKIGGISIRPPSNIINQNLTVASLYLGNPPIFTGNGISTTIPVSTVAVVRNTVFNNNAWSMQYGREGLNASIIFTKISAPNSFGVRYVPRSTSAWTVSSYNLAANIRPTTPNGLKYINITAGTTYATYPEPTWTTTLGSTVTSFPTTWSTGASYGPNFYIRPTTLNGRKYKNIRTTGTGIAGITEPFWNTTIGSITFDTSRLPWQAGSSYSVNATVRPTTPNSPYFQYKNLKNGTSNTVEPTWPTTIGQLVADTNIAVWQASTTYALNATRRPTVVTSNGLRYRVTVAGTSGATQPIWPTTVGNTIVDGTVTWICEDGGYPVFQCEDGTYAVWSAENADFPVFVCAGADGRSDDKYEFFITGNNPETDVIVYPSTITPSINQNLKISISWNNNIVNFSLNDETPIIHNLNTQYVVYPSFNNRNDTGISFPDFVIGGWALYSEATII
jgi:hypothetical protein